MVNISYVDANDNVIGAGSIGEAYNKGIIHRVVRVYLYNSKGELLLQKRSDNMKSNPGKWNESAAGHVDEGETYLQAAQRETEEEIGVRGVVLEEIKKTYTEEVGELGRKRFTVLFRGVYDGEVHPDLEEVSEVKWVSPEALRIALQEHPEQFTEGSRTSFAAL
jgi:isopentenyl-diphosphate delta-isomerase type 1